MKEVVLSGMRPTGKLHIGHLESVLSQWKELQENYDCFYFIADWHAITTETNTKNIKQNSIDMVKDWIAYGIDPEKSTLFIQSQIPEHAELSLAFSMLVNLGRLERLPTFNEYLKEIVKGGDASKKSYDEAKRAKINHGFLGYPILQSSDILLYRANFVPVGEDQLPHIELTREIARKFNSLYGDTFPIPEAKLGETPKIVGYDGKKMSKSLENAIEPTDDIDHLNKRVKMMVTDDKKVKINDPGNPYVCSVFDLHELFNKNYKVVADECRSGSRGCGDCKTELGNIIYDSYEEFRDKRKDLSDGYILEVLQEGTRKAQLFARHTMNEVKEAMLLDYFGYSFHENLKK